MAESTPKRQKGLLKLLHAAGRAGRGKRRGSKTDGQLEQDTSDATFTVLKVQVIAASNLPAADRNGKSDPFFRIVCGDCRVESAVIKSCLNPVWGQLPSNISNLPDQKVSPSEVVLQIPLLERRMANQTIEILFWDKDKLSRNDYLGETALTIDDWFPSLFDDDNVPLAFDDPSNNPQWHDLVNTRKSDIPAGRTLVRIGLADSHKSFEDAQKRQHTLQKFREAVSDRKMGRLTNLEKVFSTPPTRSFGTVKRGERPHVVQRDSELLNLFDDASSTSSDADDMSMTSSATSDADDSEAVRPFAPTESPSQELQGLKIDTDTPHLRVEEPLSRDDLLTPRASQPESFNLKSARPHSLKNLNFPTFRRSASAKSVSSLQANTDLHTQPSTSSESETSKGKMRKTPRKSSTQDSTSTIDKGDEQQPRKRRLRRRRKAEPHSWSFGAAGDILGICFLEVSSASDLPRWRNATRVTFDMDPFAVISFGKKVFRTRVIRHSLNPKWEERLFFHVRKHEEAYSIELGVFDWDRYTSNDHVGIATMSIVDLIKRAPVPSHSDQGELFACGADGLLLNDEFHDFTLPLTPPPSGEIEAGKTAKIKIRARFTPYTALRQQFWRRYMQQFDTDGDKGFSHIELYAMLDSLGSTLSTQTTDDFFRRYGKTTDDTLSIDQVVACLESELSKDAHVAVPSETTGTASPFSQTMPGPIGGAGFGFTGSHDAEHAGDKVLEPMDVPARTALTGHQDVPIRNGDESQGPLESQKMLSPPKPASTESERIINIRTCPICHKGRLNKTSEVDIVTHLAICASQDWSNLDNMMVSQFVSSEQAHRKWLGKMVSRVTKGAYSLGADSGNILVQNRMTGQLIEEKMQVYVRLGIRLGYRGMASTVEGARVRRLFASMSVKQGQKFDAPESKADIAPFIAFHGLDMNEVLEPVENFKTFNEFFYRKLKPDARPVADPNDPRTLVSAADCRMMAFPTVNDAVRIWIKGREFSLRKMLGRDYESEAARYDGGSIAIFRLAPQDYHRYHCPVDGKIGKISKVSGVYYTVNPMAIRSQVDVYGENIREIVPIDSPTFGQVMLVTVGAMMVGSIKQTVCEGQRVERGEEFGYFAFGGSTIVAVFEKGVVFDQDIVDNSNKAIETLVRVGMRIGRKVDQ